MIKILSVISLCLVCVLFFSCEDVPPDADELGVQVTRITFGRSWNSIQHVPEDTGRYFAPPLSKIYYEIVFEERFSAGGMIRKQWQHNGGQMLRATSFIPKNSHRICGELHYYDIASMPPGEYVLTVSWFSALDDDYTDYNFAQGVDQTFSIGMSGKM